MRPFLIARQNMDGSEIEVGNMLVEDENNAAMSCTDCKRDAISGVPEL